MSQLLPSVPERARKIVTTIRASLKGDETQASVAVGTGLSPATVNRLLNDHLEGFAMVLAHLEMKVVPVAFKCVDPEAYAFLTSTHERIMAKAPQLIWEREE